MTDYLSLVWLLCLFGGLAIGAGGMWLYMRAKWAEGIAHQRQFEGGLFR